MKKNILLLTILLVAGLSFPACKSKQKVVTIPNAHVEAGSTTKSSTPTSTASKVTTEQPENVRDEKFILDSEERNTNVLNQKYHVVVGSFKNRDNAKGLQQTLNSEGNNAVIVINEQGMYRILIASYPTYKEAHEKIGRIKDRFPDTWVLIQKRD